MWTLKETLRKFSRALKAEWESEPVGVGGALDLPSFWQTINPISTWGVDYVPNIIARPPQVFKPSVIPICSLVSTNFDAWTSIFLVWQKGLVWLQAVCTCPQKAIVVFQKNLLR